MSIEKKQKNSENCLEEERYSENVKEVASCPALPDNCPLPGGHRCIGRRNRPDKVCDCQCKRPGFRV